MTYNNTIAVICNKTATIDFVVKKLVLLRNVDKIISATPVNAIGQLKLNTPNVIIIHSENEDDEALRLVSNLKKDVVLKNIPVILLGENCERDFFVNAYEAGANEIITGEIKEHEVLIRTIWAIKKSELSQKEEVEKNFLKRAGIIQDETGFYKDNWGEDFLISEIKSSIKYKIDACLLLIGKNKKERFLSDVINQSIRIADNVVISREGNFYIFLPKTKLNGAYSVFERINANFRLEGGLKAGVIEIKDEGFETIKKRINDALNKAQENDETIMLASDNLNLSSNGVPKKLKGLRIKQKLKKLKDTPIDDMEIPPNEENEETRNQILFKQVFRRKINVIIEPLFKKYSTLVMEKIKNTVVDKILTDEKCELSIIFANNSSTLSIKRILSKIEIEISHIIKNEKKIKRTTMELTDLDFEKLSKMIAILIGEFRKYNDK